MTDQLDAHPARQARILIVDDEPLNVDYLEQELEGLGFVTETAANGLEALERIAIAPPDLVLLDVMMPKMDGITALQILKRDRETRLIPVVLMTALNAVEDRVRGIEAGADDFLSKPVDERELLARIKTALSHKRAVDETVGALQSTSAHLERYGRQERDVAIVAVEWRLRDTNVPEAAASFVGRRHRAAAEERIRAFGGVVSEDEGSLLIGVFEGSDLPGRTVAAVEAARAVVADPAASEERGLVVSAAIGVGSAQVGSTRVRRTGTTQWVYTADGDPVERATELARAGTEAGVLVAADAAAALSDRFELAAAGDRAYRVLAPVPEGEADSARTILERALRTVLVTDIVGSTTIVERVGDRAWADLIQAHERSTRAELALFGGEEIDTAGDGFFVSFASPGRAIRCALAIRDRADELGLAVRAGIHTGEVELVDGRARGIALHVASRIASRAEPGEVLVSATTRELTAGAGLAYADRGEHPLKGVSEPRRLYAVVEPAKRPATPSRAVDPGPSGYPAGLTAREADVLRLVAIGLSDAEVAERLFLSVRTVNAHLRSIYRKLGVRSRSAAGRFAEENGLL